MSRGALFAVWAVIAWIVPAAIAGALGWKGIWGSGSAFADYLIPIPVSGGGYQRGDDLVFYYSKLSTSSDAFRQAAPKPFASLRKCPLNF